MSDTPPTPTHARHPALIIAFNTITIALMMTCVAQITGLVGLRFSVPVNLSLIAVAAFLVSLESTFTYRLNTGVAFPSLEGLFQHLIEWVLLLTAIRIVTALFNDPAQIGQRFSDLLAAAGQLFQNPSTFFGETASRQKMLEILMAPDFLIAAAILLLVWTITRQLWQNLVLLELDEDILEQEKLGILINNRYEARRELVGFVFGIGIIILICTAITNTEIPYLPSPLADDSLAGVLITLMIYFLFGMALLAQSQFSLLQSHWYLQEVPIEPGTARNWGVYSLVLLAGITLVAMLLPTQYASGSLVLLRDAINVLMQVVMVILFGLYLGLVSIISFFMQWLNPASETVLPAAVPTPEPLVPADSAYPAPAFTLPEAVQSFFYWAILAVIVIYSLVFVLRRLPSPALWLKNLPFGSTLSHIWAWLAARFKQAGNGLGALAQAGIQRLRTLRTPQVNLVNALMNIAGSLPAREQIILTYVAMIQWNEGQGIFRRPQETPMEYQRRVAEQVPEMSADLALITGFFIEARYTRHPLEKEQAAETRAAWERLRQAVLAHLQAEAQKAAAPSIQT
ncbi:MAG TPA: DUF4129 domain-containing protein [Anaerolineaceae bacterium]|nr:DUF4129 domain-containing protein [Anaerolineaceae bacterium]HPN52894.1 DUF4129 domain-containing protein [Anaerolineaceae bacterium]